MNLAQAYRAERAPLFVPAMDTGRMVECRQDAKRALREARIRVEWQAADGFEIDEWEAQRSDDPPYSGRVRLLIRNDEDWSAALDGDFSARELATLRERCERDGVCGVEAQFWDGAQWQAVDSVWGFIGSDWRRSGYDTDLMRAALDALAEHDAIKARAQEARRPDIYQH